jgi:hypothetical protein
MQEYKCPFSAPLITHQFGCTKATEVVRRGGVEINCTDAAAWSRCDQLFQRMKLAALPAFGVEDDLLSMPHSVLVKVQYGGLLGLQRLLRAEPQVGERVDDIHTLVVEASLRFGNEVPCGSLVDDITAFKPRARRGR